MPKKLSPGFIAFLQATGVFVYVLLIGAFIFNANRFFGPMPVTLGPVLFLLLFIVSALVCTLIFLGYPFLLFWEHKQTKAAFRLVLYSTAWLVFYLASVLLFLIFPLR